MIQVTIQKYHLKNNPGQKKAALITLQEPATEANIQIYQDKLGILLRQQYDCYILIAGQADVVNAYTLKLLISFRNTAPDLVGLLMNDAIERIAVYSRLDTFFVTDVSTGAIIGKIEAKKRTLHGQ